MKISTELYGVMQFFDEKESLELIKKAGFDCVDYSYYWLDDEDESVILGDNYISHAKEIKKYLDKIGLQCNQAHAPFNVSAEQDFDLSVDSYKKLIHSIESAAILGAKNIVVHALAPTDNETVLDTNIKFYKSLEPYAEKAGIKIAVENLFGEPYDEIRKKYINNLFDRPEKMIELLQQLGSKNFVCCIDVGHASITDIAPETYIQSLNSDILKALHIQDNHFCEDEHLLPYVGDINWNNVAKSLAEIGYDGELTLEIFGFLKRFPKELVLDVLKLACATERHLTELVDKYKTQTILQN